MLKIKDVVWVRQICWARWEGKRLEGRRQRPVVGRVSHDGTDIELHHLVRRVERRIGLRVEEVL